MFLRVLEDDPTTLYYHFAEPNEEAEPQDEYGFRYSRTTISQIVCFTLLAFRSEKRSQAWRDGAIQHLQTFYSFRNESSASRYALQLTKGRCVIEIVNTGIRIEFPDKAGWSSLYWASRSGYENTGRLLLEVGA